MTDLMRLLPRCVYVGKCGYPCTVSGVGDTHPLLLIRPAETPGEMIISCANYRKKQQEVDDHE